MTPPTVLLLTLVFLGCTIYWCLTHQAKSIEELHEAQTTDDSEPVTLIIEQQPAPEPKWLPVVTDEDYPYEPPPGPATAYERECHNLTPERSKDAVHHAGR